MTTAFIGGIHHDGGNGRDDQEDDNEASFEILILSQILERLHLCMQHAPKDSKD